MSENKFIKKLKGESTAKSVLEIKNQSVNTSFANMPLGTSDANRVYADHSGDAVGVLQGAENWKLNGSTLVYASSVNSDGNDYTGETNKTGGSVVLDGDGMAVSGAGLWVNATYTFTGDPTKTVAIFNAGTKWVLKLCGHSLFSDNKTIDLTVLIKIGASSVISKVFTVTTDSFNFCKDLVIDFAESAQTITKVQGNETLKLQVLCSDTSASATIYNGMTVLTALVRKVDGNAVASNTHTFDDLSGGVDYLKGHIIVKSDTMPTATADLLGEMYQYTGTTTAPYEHGYIYECVEVSAGVYDWQRVDVQPGGSRGRFLSLWNSATGLAETNPPISPYEYKTGDYFIVGTVSTATPAVNYKPDGTSYVTGTASTVVESEQVNIDDTYFFDGANWKLQSNNTQAKVNVNGTSIMTGPLKMVSGSMRGAFSPYLNGVGFFKMDAQNNLTQIATLSDTQFLPTTTDAIGLGSSAKKFKDLYLSGTEYFDNGKGIRFAGTASNRYFNIETNQDEIRFIHKYGSYDASLSFRAYTGDVVIYPHNDDRALFGLPTRRWQRVYATNLCSDTSGANLINVPNKAGTMALTSDIAIKSTEAQITSPANNQVLKYNGSKWVNATIQDLDNVISNCTTEIPQDILVEINGSNGLTLKSGSKLYQPNGSGIFTPIAIDSDKQRNDFSAFGSGTYMVFYSQSYGGLIAVAVNNCVSGATDTSTASTHVWYDTTNNVIKTYESGTYMYTDLSLPICIMTNTYGTGVVSIDEIFNGFGYIGVTIFRTGIDYLIPNGFNSDGTLKNTTVSTTSCATYTVSSPTVNHRYSIAGASNGSIALFYTNIEYNEKENLNYAGGSQTAWADLGFVIFTGSPARITSFNPKQTFHAVDYYDFKYGNNTFFGNNTFSGTNTFTGLTRSESGSPKFEYKNTGMNVATSGGTSLGDTYIADARDANSAQSGYIYNRMLNGTLSMKLGAVSKTTGSVKSSEVAAIVENSGKRYVEATTPTKSDNTTDLSSNTNAIATTEWVKSYAMGLPDWSSQTTLTNGTTNTASKNGYVYGGSSSGDMAGHITVNGNDVFEVRTTHTGFSKGIVPVAKGDVITLPASGTYYFVPCKNL